MKTCLVITGGPLDTEFAETFLEERRFTRVIAVGAGLETAKKLNLVPDVVVGDFDTVKPEILEEFRAMEHIVWDVHRPEKDETDTELAFARACAMGCGEIAVLGATGGRLDHLIGNIHLLYPCMQKGIFAYLLDPQNKVYLLDSGKDFFKETLWGKYVSFLPLTQKVTGITLTGFKYPLFQKDIEIGTSLCISNELTEPEARLDFEDGVLICVESHD